jgi:hypothetical protein
MADDFDSDAMLAFFGQLGKEIDQFKVKIVSLNEAGTAMKKITDETEKFGQTIHRHTRSTMRGMEGSVSGLIGLIGGAGGLALSIAGAARALDQFAISQLQLRNFATNTGFSASAVKDMRVQLSAAGMSANEAAQGVGNIGARLQEVLALQETSGFYRSLQASSPAMAEQVRHLMNAGRQQEALNVLQEAFNKGGERFKAWLPTVTGVSRAAWEAQRYGMEGLIKPWTFLDAEAIKYHKTMVNLGTIFEGVWNSVSQTFLEGIVTLTGAGGIEDLNKKALKFAEDFKKFFDANVMPTLRTTMKEVRAIIALLERAEQLWEESKKPKEGVVAPSETPGFDFSELQKDFPEVKPKEESDLAKAGRESQQGITDLAKESNTSIRAMRDLIQKWDDELTGGIGGSGGVGGGRTATGVGDGASPESSQGSRAQLNDEGGKVIDADTMKQAEMLGRAGDVAGLQRLFAARGYKMSGPACGIVASGYVKSAGFKPPPGGAIATSWHKWGEGIKDPNDINAPGRPFGSMVGTYWHGRYGGTQGQVLPPGAKGGHVMTVVPGTYDPKTGTVDMVDQYGYSHGKRSIKDIDFRYAGAEAVAAAEKARNNQRGNVDKALSPNNPWNKPSAGINLNLKNVPTGVNTDADIDSGVFNTLKINRSNQMATD